MNKWLLAVTAVACIAAVARAGEEMPPPLDPDLVRSGRMVYGPYCASCHGASSEGAPNWRERDKNGELPAPPHGPQGHTWRHSDAMLYEMTSKGYRDPFNKTDRLTMPGFADVLSSEQIRAVITYLKTLWTPEQRQFQWEESRDQPVPPSRTQR